MDYLQFHEIIVGILKAYEGNKPKTLAKLKKSTTGQPTFKDIHDKLRRKGLLITSVSTNVTSITDYGIKMLRKYEKSLKDLKKANKENEKETIKEE